MLGLLAKWDLAAAKTNGRDKFPVSCSGLKVWRVEAEQFGLLWDKLDVVLGAVFHGELEEVLQLEDTVTYKAGIVCLADGGDTDSIHGEPKLGVLSGGQLLVVGEFVEPITKAAALLHSELVEDWAHQTLIPLDKCLPVGEPVSKIQEALPPGASKESIPDDKFSQDLVESRLGIEQQGKQRLLGGVQGELDGFGEE